MINLEYNTEHQRIGASCHECTRECRLRKYIDSPDIMCCNYAAYGCVKYNGHIKHRVPKGGARVGDPSLNNVIRNRILELKKFKISDFYDLTPDRQRVINCISMLRKMGYDIVNTVKNEDSEFEVLE